MFFTIIACAAIVAGMISVVEAAVLVLHKSTNRKDGDNNG